MKVVVMLLMTIALFIYIEDAQAGGTIRTFFDMTKDAIKQKTLVEILTKTAYLGGDRAAIVAAVNELDRDKKGIDVIVLQKNSVMVQILLETYQDGSIEKFFSKNKDAIKQYTLVEMLRISGYGSLPWTEQAVAKVETDGDGAIDFDELTNSNNQKMVQFIKNNCPLTPLTTM